MKYLFTANDGFVLGFVFILNSTNVKIIFESRDLGCIQNLYSLFLFTKFAAQKGKARMETTEGFVNFVYFINFWTREQAQSKACKHAERTTNVINGHYMLASPSIKQLVSNKCHKRERQVNRSHASGCDNFNGAKGLHKENYERAKVFL